MGGVGEDENCSSSGSNSSRQARGRSGQGDRAAYRPVNSAGGFHELASNMVALPTARLSMPQSVKMVSTCLRGGIQLGGAVVGTGEAPRQKMLQCIDSLPRTSRPQSVTKPPAKGQNFAVPIDHCVQGTSSICRPTLNFVDSQAKHLHQPALQSTPNVEYRRLDPHPMAPTI